MYVHVIHFYHNKCDISYKVTHRRLKSFTPLYPQSQNTCYNQHKSRDNKCEHLPWRIWQQQQRLHTSHDPYTSHLNWALINKQQKQFWLIIVGQLLITKWENTEDIWGILRFLFFNFHKFQKIKIMEYLRKVKSLQSL